MRNNFNYLPKKKQLFGPHRKDSAGDDSSTAAATDHKKKIFNLIPGIIPRFLQINRASNNSSQAQTAAAAAAAAASIREPLISRITPVVLGFLGSRGINNNSSSSSETTTTTTETTEDVENGGGIISRIGQRIPPWLSLRSRRTRTEETTEDDENGGGIISRIRQRIPPWLSRRRRGGGPRASFHEPQIKILIAEGLPIPPAGMWYRLTPTSLGFLENLASKKQECIKAIKEMNSGSSATLCAFSTLMFAVFGFVTYMDGDDKILTCEHLKFLVFFVCCSLSFQILLGYTAMSQTGNNFWMFSGLKAEVLGLKVQMEDQLHEMEVVDYEDDRNKGFQAMVDSCKVIAEPLALSKKIVFQILTILVTIITVGFTVNNAYLEWRRLCTLH